ncbi:MAG: acyl carrier protein [Haliea sp.]
MIRHEIREYLVAHRASQASGEFAEQDSLLEAGVIDSMTMVDLIVHLEKRYGISIDEDDMTPENFDSIEAIVAYVIRKQGSESSGSRN